MVSRLPVIIRRVLLRLRYRAKRGAESFHEVSTVLKCDHPGCFPMYFKICLWEHVLSLFTLFQAL